MPPAKILRAFIDESGDRSLSPKSPDHFVLSAVAIAHGYDGQIQNTLAQLRADFNLRPHVTLHWQSYRTHSQRLHAAQLLAAQSGCRIVSIVVAKRLLTGSAALTQDQAYMYTFRFLLERLSWLARSAGSTLEYTLAHIQKFKFETLRDYETRLRRIDTKIDWRHVSDRCGVLGYPKTHELLQAADLAASATAAAFNADRYGNVTKTYIEALAPALYRRSGRHLRYGLKLHPSALAEAQHQWVHQL